MNHIGEAMGIFGVNAVDAPNKAEAPRSFYFWRQRQDRHIGALTGGTQAG